MGKRIYTYIGLFISYFSITGISLLFKSVFGQQLNNGESVLRELLIFFMVGVLFWIIIKKEKLTLRSIGLYPENFKRSLLWAAITAALCFLGAFLGIFISEKLGWSVDKPASFSGLSYWTITLVVIRAGIAEEVFMRGYVIERLSSLTGSVYLASTLSLIPFALLHYSFGPKGVLIAFILGAILTFMYVWKRDLKANIIAHFLVDFIANVLLPLLGAG